MKPEVGSTRSAMRMIVAKPEACKRRAMFKRYWQKCDGGGRSGFNPVAFRRGVLKKRPNHPRSSHTRTHTTHVMRNAFPTFLVTAGGTYAIAFVQPAGWVPPPPCSRREHSLKSRSPIKPRVFSNKVELHAQTLTLEVASSMIARPDKAARGGSRCMGTGGSTCQHPVMSAECVFSSKHM